MAELDDDRAADAAWQPAGLKAAAEAMHAQEDAQPQDAPPAGDPSSAPMALAWEPLVELVLELVFSRLEKRDELWRLEAGERASLARAWSEYLRTVAMAPGPLAGALLATGVVVGPRLVEDVRKRRARTVDVDAEVRETGPQ